MLIMSRTSVDGDAKLLIREGEARQIGLRWPVGVDHLVNVLVERANGAGANCSRKELTAALVVDRHALSGEDLLDVLVNYRRARTNDIVPVGTDKASAATRRKISG